MDSNSQVTVNISQRAKALLMIGLFCLIATDMLVVYELATAIPAVLGEIGGMNLIALVFTTNMLGSAIMAPVAGSLSSIFGRRRTLIICGMLLTILEPSSALVTNVTQLIVLRGIQGVVSSFALTVTLIVIADVCTPPERAKYLGLYGSVMAAYMIVGSAIGGIITDNFHWRWIFAIVLPVGLVGTFLVYRYMPVIPRDSEGKVDVLGSVVMTVTISLIVFVTVVGGDKYSWSSPIMLSLYLASLIGLVLFVFVEKRASTPIMPMSLFSNPKFVMFFISVFFVTAAAIPAAYYLPLYFQEVRGLSATYAGMLMTSRGVLAVIFSAANGWIISRVKEFRWNALVLVALYCLANVSFSMMGAATPMAVIGVSILVWGLAAGSNNVFLTGTQMTLRHSQIVSAMGVLQLAVTFGGTISNIVIGVLLKNPDFTKGLHNVFLVAVVSLLIVLLLIVVMLLMRNKIYSEDNQVNVTVSEKPEVVT
ncbi:MFS transporter [Phosphitispora sp. TUW77]|uniref:MFS transporter n=1 Tax=Phosphitispora sp. TUW77 TaxID=3152361 RepID=UPI003AB62B8F